MKIGIDCRMFGLKHAGIGRYVENLVKELSKSKNKEIKFLLFVRNKKQFEQFQHLDNFNIIQADFPHYSIKEQLLLPLQLISTKGGSPPKADGPLACASGGKLRLDLVHFPHFNVPILYFGKYVVTIHDLIKHTSRGMKTTTRKPLLYWLKYLGYRFVFWNAVKRARKILVPSEWVKGELVKQYKLNPSKVVVTYEGISRNFQFPRPLRVAKQGGRAISNFQSKRNLNKYKISKPFIIYTGSLYPHKNIERLIRAIKLLNSSLLTPHSSLVIVCARSVFSERLKKKAEELGAKRLVNFVGFVPDEELVQIYQEAVALVQPSFMEGFDLTVVEVMAAGLPVVISDIPIHREICGQAALYFDPEDPADIAEKIKFIIENESERERLKKVGLEQVKKYSWEKTAQKTLEVYRSIAKR